MRNFFSIILFVVILIAADGCRSRCEAQRVTRSDLSLEAVLEARHLDSVSLSDNFFEYVNIEFFPPDSAQYQIQTGDGEVFPIGALRRVTVETRRNATVVRTVADTVAVHESLSESESEKVDVVEDRNKESLPIPAVILLIGALLSLLVIYRMGK